MNFLNPAECYQWSIDTGHLVDEEKIQIANVAEHRCKITYGTDSRKAALFSKSISKLETAPGSRLLWISEYGIWPSEDDWEFFSYLRTTLGEHRSLREAPGFLFSAEEQPLISGWLRLVVAFGWGGTLLFESGATLVKFSHDGWSEIESCNSDVEDTFVAFIKA